MPKARQYYTIKVPKGQIKSLNDKNGRPMLKPVTYVGEDEKDYDILSAYLLPSEIAQVEKELAKVKNGVEKSSKKPADFIKEKKLKVKTDVETGE